MAERAVTQLNERDPRRLQAEPGELRAVAPVFRRSLPEKIVEQLLRLIASDVFPSGQLPPERLLCEQLAVSRTSLREALSALDQLGVLETRGKRKYGRLGRARMQLAARSASSGSDRQLLDDPMEVRRMLEPEVAARAAQRANDEGLAEISRWLRLMEEGVERGEPVIDLDIAFHVSIARATGNRTLVHVVSALTDAVWESRETSFLAEEGGRTALAGHKHILAAIAGRDARKARQAMHHHLDEVERLIRSFTEEPPRGSIQAHG